MYEFNWLLTRAFRQNGTGTKGKTDRQRDKETKRQRDRQTKRGKHKHKDTRILAVFWACRVVCWCALCLSVTDICGPPQATKCALRYIMRIIQQIYDIQGVTTMQNGVKQDKIPHTTPFCAGVSKECHLPSIFFNFSYLIYFYFLLRFAIL